MFPGKDRAWTGVTKRLVGKSRFRGRGGEGTPGITRPPPRRERPPTGKRGGGGGWVQEGQGWKKIKERMATNQQRGRGNPYQQKKKHYRVPKQKTRERSAPERNRVFVFAKSPSRPFGHWGVGKGQSENTGETQRHHAFKKSNHRYGKKGNKGPVGKKKATLVG